MSRSRLVVFRVDSSVDMGIGHVMRCLTLADALKKQGFRTLFLSRRHTGHSAEAITNRGHAIELFDSYEWNSAAAYETGEYLKHAAWLGCDMEFDAHQTRQVLAKLSPDWLVVDHYALNHRWESIQRPYSKSIMAIDDLADRKHDVDLLLDQNLGRIKEDYKALIPENASLLLGPKHALLKPDFNSLREKSLARRVNQSRINHILITMGGIDKDNATGRLLGALAQTVLNNIQITVVMGKNSPWLRQILEMAANSPYLTKVLIDTNIMAQLMVDSDIAFGAAGSTSWERCCLGLPTMMVIQAENQMSAATALEACGAAEILNLSTTDLAKHIKSRLQAFSHEEGALLKSMSKHAASITDGSGVHQITRIMCR